MKNGSNDLDQGSSQDDPDEITSQLHRVLKSEMFASSGRLQKLLSHIVHETLAGRGDNLLGKNIAHDVIGQSGQSSDKDFSTIRVEVGRLRRRLDQYYAAEGAGEQVRITIPKGGYIAIFEPAASPPEHPESGDEAQPEPKAAVDSRRRSIQIAMALGVLVAVAIGGILWLTYDRGQERKLVSRATDGVAPSVIAVLPFAIIGDSPLGQQLAAGVSEDIVTELSQLAGLQVIAYGSSSRLAGHENPQDEAKSQLGATHLLRGRIQIESGSFRINVRLEDLTRDRQIWADSFDYQLGDLLLAQAEISRHVSSALAIAFPDHSQEKVDGTAVFNMAARVLADQGTVLARPASDVSRVKAATLLFERAIELEPLDPSGHAGLAYLQALASWFGSVQDVDAAIEAAVDNARQAISLDRNSVRALIALSVVAMLRNDYDKAIEHLESAVVAWPSDPLVNAWRGLMLTYAGQAQQGILPLLTARRLDPINPRTPYLNMLGMAYFHSGDMESALETITKNFEDGGPRGPHMMAYVVAGYFHLGEMDKARQAFQDFQKIEGGFSLERWLQLSFEDPKDIEKVLAPLRQLRADN